MKVTHWITGLYYRIKNRNRCIHCGRKCGKDNDYFKTWMTCDSNCYGEMVGIYY